MRIRVCVQGGVVQDVEFENCPAGIEVIIEDEDDREDDPDNYEPGVYRS